MNFDEAMRELEGMPGKVNRVLRNTITRATKKVADESRLNAPKSPTQDELDSDRLKRYKAKYSAKYGKKAGARMAKARLARVQARREVDENGLSQSRNPNASSRPMPGELVRSIDHDVLESPGEIVGSVFVSSNSKAGQYAAIIHDAKGKAWNERGIGTKKKGPRADDKFIERALNASEPNTFRILENEVTKALGAT